MYINDVYLEKERILTPIELSLITKKDYLMVKETGLASDFIKNPQAKGKIYQMFSLFSS